MAYRVEKERKKEHQKLIKKIVNRREQAEFLAYEIDKAYWQLSKDRNSSEYDADGFNTWYDFEEMILFAKNNKMIRLNDSVKLQRMNELAQSIYLYNRYIHRYTTYNEICGYFGFLPLIATETETIGL